jgi:hypothetical protein
VVISLLHAGVGLGVAPFALVSSQTSFWRGFPAAASAEDPANRIIVFESGSYTDVDPLRSRGNVRPPGLSGPHFGLAVGLSVLIPAITARKPNTVSATLKIAFVRFTVSRCQGNQRTELPLPLHP